jgi:hypothetical protein
VCSQQDMSSDESITDCTEDLESGQYDHTHSRCSPWPVHPLGHVTVKQGSRARTSALHQVKNLAPGKLRSVGLLLDGKCKVCTSARCLHTSEYRKTCWNAPHQKVRTLFRERERQGQRQWSTHIQTEIARERDRDTERQRQGERERETERISLSHSLSLSGQPFTHFLTHFWFWKISPKYLRWSHCRSLSLCSRVEAQCMTGLTHDTCRC